MNIRHRLNLLLGAALTSEAVPMTQRVAILRRLGATVGTDPELWPARFIHPENLTIGDRVFINYDCFIESMAPLIIGDDVSLGPRVSLLTTSHQIGPSYRRAGQMHRTATKIGNGVWVGAGAQVMPGVTVGDGCMIAAGAVVVGACEPDGLYAGVPARRVRDLPTEP